MIRHSNSFFVSLFIHGILFALLYISYKTISAEINKGTKEPLLCVKLSSLCRANEKVLNPSVHQEVKENEHLKKVAKVSQPVKQKKIKKIEKIKKKVLPKKKTIERKTLEAPQKTKIEKKRENRVKRAKREEIVPLAKLETKKTVKKEIAAEKEYIDDNIEKIIKLLQENLYYPRHARRRGIEGSVLVRFTLSKDAEVTNLHILSSRSPILSHGALQTIKNIGTRFPKPKQSITFNIPISYKLH